MGKKYVVILTEQQLVKLISEQTGSDVVAKFIRNMLSNSDSKVSDTKSKDSDVNIPVDGESTSKTSVAINVKTGRILFPPRAKIYSIGSYKFLGSLVKCKFEK